MRNVACRASLVFWMSVLEVLAANKGDTSLHIETRPIPPPERYNARRCRSGTYDTLAAMDFATANRMAAQGHLSDSHVERNRSWPVCTPDQRNRQHSRLPQ